MCGIFGAIATEDLFDGNALEQFRRFSDLVSYRGPDDSGYVCLNLKNDCKNPGGFDIFLGHRRLSIIDLSTAGHQPMEMQRCWIVYNGEIFNFIELREELKAKGHRFRTGTDTEVILHIYAEYGERGFEKLNGMWAFAIVDVPRRRVVLSRDRFSIKPLYLLKLPGRFYFASEIKQLLPLLPSKRLNVGVMSAFLSQGLIDHSPETFFEGIVRIPAKCNVVVDLARPAVNPEPYWDYGRYRSAHTDVVDEFRYLLEDSIRIRLRSDVKVGVLLSGGLDSSSIAVIADALGCGLLETYSLVSNDPTYSETEFIEAVCSAKKLNCRKIDFRPEHSIDAMKEAVHHSDEPFAGCSVLAQYKLFREIKQETDATVLLSGQGGDEVLLGYIKFFLFYVRELIRGGAYFAAAAQVLASLLQGTMLRQVEIAESRRFLPFLNRFQHIIRANCDFIPLASCRNLRDRQIADIDMYSVPALAHYEDRNSMAHSLEVRHPFLDHRLVDFVVGLPPGWKIYDGWSKYLLRTSLPELPDKVRWRKDKKGFITPEERWLKLDFADTIRNSFRHSRLSHLGVIDEKEFLRYYGEFQNGHRIAYTDISRVLVAEIWARQHFS